MVKTAHTDPGSSPARQRLLAAAEELFYTRGINATGVDAVIDAADVARMTFYNHFRGKAALVAAYLEARDMRWRDTLEHAITEAGDDPRARLLAVFDALETWTSAPEYRGCSFVNAAAEIAGADHPARTVIADHKAALRERIGTLARAVGRPGPELLADRVLLLFEGAVVTEALDTVPDAVPLARDTAHRLIEA